MGQRRLDTPEDFVRVEIQAALARDIRVIPILVGGAVMPRARELPEALAKLARRNALELSDTRWHTDVGTLLELVETLSAAAQRRASLPPEPIGQEASPSTPSDNTQEEVPREREDFREEVKPANLQQQATTGTDELLGSIFLGIIGIAWVAGFAYWSVYSSQHQFSWWSVVTGILALLGACVVISILSENKPDNKS